MPQEKMLSVDELAELLGVPRCTVYRWSSDRTGPPAYRVGRFLRYRPTEVESWLNSRRHDERAVPV